MKIFLSSCIFFFSIWHSPCFSVNSCSDPRCRLEVHGPQMLCREVWSPGRRPTDPPSAPSCPWPPATHLLASPPWLDRRVRGKRPPLGSPPHDLAPGSFWFSPWVGQRHPWVFSSSAGLGDGAAPCGSQHLLQPHGPPVWGCGRRPQPLQGRPRSSVGAGKAWRAAPSPPLSLHPGPPQPSVAPSTTDSRFPTPCRLSPAVLGFVQLRGIPSLQF